MAGTRPRKIGLARALSKFGYCSRSQAAQLIRAGRVKLQGEIRRDPESPVFEDFAQIAVDGKVIAPLEKIHLLLNKPRGIVVTASDEKGRDTVYTLLNLTPGLANEAGESWIAPIGRLDKASEGLLLMTNDSEWGARIAAPETHLPKTYHVQITARADEKLLQLLVRGVKGENGDVMRATSAALIRSGEKNCWIEIVLDEGKNRQIRRMLESCEVEVLRLIRVAIGPLLLGDLKKGDYRPVSRREKQMLDEAMRNASGFSRLTAAR